MKCHVWLLLGVSLLSARAESSESSEPSFVVVVTAIGEAKAVSSLETRIRALLSTFPVTIEWTLREQFRSRDVLSASSNPALARIWLDTRDPTRAVLYLVDDAHERYLVRVVPLESGYDEVACESVGTIVESSIEALVSGAAVGVSREAAQQQVLALESGPPQPTPTPVARAVETKISTPLRTRPPYRLAFDVSYRAQMVSEEPILKHGPEIGAFFRRSGPGLSAIGFATIGYSVPVHWEVNGIGATFEGGLVRGGSGLRYGLGAQGSLSLLGVAGADWSVVEPTATEAGTSPRSTSNVFSPTVGLLVEAERLVARSFATWVAFGAEVDLLGHHYDALVQGQPQPILDPWPVRPLARLGVRIFP